MEKDRLKAVSYRVCKCYVIVGSALFVLWDILVWISYVSEENIREYCIPVSDGGRYDFRVNENSACLIDWMYFIREPLLLSILLYALLFFPAFLVMRVSRR